MKCVLNSISFFEYNKLYIVFKFFRKITDYSCVNEVISVNHPESISYLVLVSGHFKTSGVHKHRNRNLLFKSLKLYINRNRKKDFGPKHWFK